MFGLFNSRNKYINVLNGEITNLDYADKFAVITKVKELGLDINNDNIENYLYSKYNKDKSIASFKASDIEELVKIRTVQTAIGKTNLGAKQIECEFDSKYILPSRYDYFDDNSGWLGLSLAELDYDTLTATSNPDKIKFTDTLTYKNLCCLLAFSSAETIVSNEDIINKSIVELRNNMKTSALKKGSSTLNDAFINAYKERTNNLDQVQRCAETLLDYSKDYIADSVQLILGITSDKPQQDSNMDENTLEQ